MKIALVTTTVHVPHALKLLRKCSADVRFFVAGDRKTPKEAYELVLSLDENSTVCLPELGHKWKCSEALGWNTLARRNIAFLEALKWGADVIYSWDTDNYPADVQHFDHIDRLLGPTIKPMWFEFFNGLKVSSPDGWFDPGSLLVPPVRHRGIPHHLRPSRLVSPVTDAKVGVAAGLIIGDPDIDASTRMEHHPDIGSVHVLGDVGVVVDPGTHTVFNTQNTAMIRELVPAWFLMPGVGRHDDIYSSLIVQRVARERGYHVHFGRPIAFQERHPHNLLTDLRAEIDGMERVEQIAQRLDRIEFSAGMSVVEQTRAMYVHLAGNGLIPGPACAAALLWLEDVESVL